MDRQKINNLRRIYQQNHSSPIKREMQLLYEYYIKSKEKALLDIVTTTAALGTLLHNNGVDVNDLSPQMMEAFESQYPNVDLTEVLENGDLEGYINGWKGKYFEVLTRDELNDGSAVGDVQLSEGQFATLADSPTQPGWDLQIHHADGSVAQELQLKATDSLSYVKQALEENPDISVLATEEVFASGASVDGILNSGLSEQSMESEISAAASDASNPSLMEDMGDFVIPGLPFVLIAATEGGSVLMGKKSFDVALRNSLNRSVKSGVSLGVGGAVAALDGGIISIPATIGTRIGMDRLEIYKKMNEQVDESKEELIKLLPEYT